MTTGTTPTNTFLLAVDGSEHSHAAARTLASLICRPGTDPAENKVHLLAAFTPTQATDLDPLRSAVYATEQLFADCQVSTTSELVLGHPAEKILETASALKARMIVMGARGLRATLGILLGGVAQQVVEYGCFPTLVVRAPFRKIQKALLVTDGSLCSQKAAAFTARMPLPPGAEIVALHVLLPVPPQIGLEFYGRSWPLGAEILPPPPEVDAYDKQWYKEEEARGGQILAETVAVLGAGGRTATSELHRGDSATEIIEFARANQFDLIITGSRGLSAIKGWFLGSVSRKLVHYAPCSVLVVRETACLE